MKRKITNQQFDGTEKDQELRFEPADYPAKDWLNMNMTIDRFSEGLNAKRTIENQLNFPFKEFDSFLSESETKITNKMIIRFNPSGFIDYVSERTLKVLNLKKREMLGHNIEAFNESLGIKNSNLFDDLQHDFHAQSLTQMFIDNEKKWLLWDFEAKVSMDASLEFILATGHEINDFVNSNNNFIQDKKRDYLTGLWNRQGLHEQIAKRESQIHHAVSFFIDCWSFSKIIDYFGNHVSDEVILLMAKEMQRISKDLSVVFRYAENQFVLLCINENATPEKITMMLEELQKNLVTVYKIRDLNFQIEKRIGYALFPDDTQDLGKLVSCSSLAMKESVKLDQISVKRYQKFMSESLEQTVLFARKLREALDSGHIEVYFQKIINVSNDQVVSFEELARWNDPELGYISPKTMFAIAKESNMIDKLDRYLVVRAILAIKQVSALVKYRNTKLALNITPSSLLDPLFLQYLDEKVLEYGLVPDDICIEISEGTFVHSLDLCIERINEFKLHGYGIAIDDFGREYSSLAILEHVAFDIIKIDALFVDRITQPKNQEIIKMIAKIAKLANQKIIAEGVETMVQRDILKELGCMIQQGYFFNRPEKVASFLK
jgi:diguanylate cyclase (GGDEF)-like protein